MHVFIIIFFNAVNFWLNAKKQSIYNCCSYFREKLLNLFPRLNPRFFTRSLVYGCFAEGLFASHLSSVCRNPVCRMTFLKCVYFKFYIIRLAC